MNWIPKKQRPQTTAFPSHYWISLIFFLFPIVIFGIFIFLYNINSNRNYINQTKLSSFQQASTQIGYLLEHLKGLSANFNSEDTLMDNEIILALNEIEQNSQIAAEAFYYVKGDNYAYSSSQKYQYHKFEELYSSLYNVSRSNLFIRLNTRSSPCLFRLYLQDGPVNDGLIAYICPVSKNASVFFLIPESTLMDKFQDYFGDTAGELLVYNNSFEVILSTIPDNKDALETHLLRIKGSGLIFLEETRQIALRQTIGYNDMTIVSVMSQSDFYRQLHFDQWILAMLITLMIVCCLILTAYGIRLAQKPIHKLAQAISGKEFPRGAENEVAYIHNAFLQSKEHTHSLMLRLSAQNALLAGQFALRLINGHFQTSEEALRYADYIGIHPDKTWWAVLDICPQPGNSSHSVTEQLLDSCNAFQADGCTCLTTEAPRQSGICCIAHFNTQDAQQKPEDYLAGLAGALHSHFAGNDLFPAIGVGTPYQEVVAVKRSFYEADAALQNANGASANPIVYYFIGDANQDYNLPPMDKSLLISGISRGETEIALSALNSLLSRIESSTRSYLYSQLLSTRISSFLLQLGQDYNMSLTQNDWADFITFQSVSAFRDCAERFTRKLCSLVQQQIAQQDTLQKNTVLTFIKENFTKEEFSLDYLSDSLNLTKTKISGILKEDLNLGFQQYLSLLRINEIKRQLTETDKPIQMIIRDVGYIDASSAIRRFKSVEGITPGQYRTLHKNPQNTDRGETGNSGNAGEENLGVKFGG